MSHARFTALLFLMNTELPWYWGIFFDCSGAILSLEAVAFPELQTSRDKSVHRRVKMSVQAGGDVITSAMVKETQKLPVRGPHRRHTYGSTTPVCVRSVEVCAFFHGFRHGLHRDCALPQLPLLSLPL